MNDIETQQMYNLLKEKLKVIKDKNALKGLNLDELILVLDLIISPKFKTPMFEKYEGTTCSEAHLVACCCKMVEHTNNKKLFIYVFQDSFMGAAFKWCLKLRRNQIRTWNDLAKVFLE